MNHALISTTKQRVMCKTIWFTPQTIRVSAQRLAQVYATVSELNGRKKKVARADLNAICEAVCYYFTNSIFPITPDVLKTKNRKRDIVKPRQIFMYLAMETEDYSLMEIGKFTGGFDHTTVIHSCNTVRDLMASDAIYRLDVINIKNKIR